jgi:hypothetical protein
VRDLAKKKAVREGNKRREKVQKVTSERNIE